MDLHEAIRQDDALDFMARGFTREQHIECFTPEYREQNAKSWDSAAELVKSHGTIRKAQNFIGRQIDTYR